MTFLPTLPLSSNTVSPPSTAAAAPAMASTSSKRTHGSQSSGLSVGQDDLAADSGTGIRAATHRRPQRLRILIVRHGETDHNVRGVIQGQLDTDLNKVGHEQAKHVAAALAHEHVDEVYASPLRRARDTATVIVRAHPNHHYGRLVYWLDDRLKERGFGALEGNTYDRSKPRRDSIQGIEQMNTFCARLSSFLADSVSKPAPFATTDEDVASASQPPRTRLFTSKDGAPPQEGLQKGILWPPPLPADAVISGPPLRLNKGMCTRTIVVVAHGAAISAMVGSVLLDTGLACMSAGVQRTRVWNCSITEIIVHNVDTLPTIASSQSKRDGEHRPIDLAALAQQPGKKSLVIERWADVRHLPDDLDDAAVTKGSADEMVGRATG